MLFEWWWVLVRVGAGAARGALYLPMVSPSASSSSSSSISSSPSSPLSLRWFWKSKSHKQNLKGLYVPSTTTVFTAHLSVPLLSSVANGGLDWECGLRRCVRECGTGLRMLIHRWECPAAREGFKKGHQEFYWVAQASSTLKVWKLITRVATSLSNS